MSDSLEELPLFPLDTVLFPSAQLQLHVFEERYRRMVLECLEMDQRFGIVLIRTGTLPGPVEPYMVGTAVRILATHTYEDGRMDIQVQGERRFRIRELDESRPYLVGKVEPVIELELEETSDLNDLFAKAREDCELLVRRRFEHQGVSVKVVFPPDPVALSFTIANLLPMENLEKQRLLETTDTRERVESLIPVIERQMIQSPFHRISGDDLSEFMFPN